MILGTTTCLLVLTCLLFLPHNRYVRWQDVQVEAYARLGWIYERIHFDPTPIDIAFIGTSRTMCAVDAAAVALEMERLQAAGTEPKKLHAVNFAIPVYGRNLHWLIARELLENRKVGMLILEIYENESRHAHPYFIYPAEVSDVLDAPLLINPNYFSDIAFLPFRQISLFVKTLWPGQFGLKGHFDPAHYDGSTVDNTRFIQVGGKRLTKLLDQKVDQDKLKVLGRERRQQKALHMLGQYFDNLEYRLPRYYLSLILELADRERVPVKFLYLPSYGEPDRPFDMRLYQGKGEMITVNDILATPGNWANVDHLNMFGAAQVSTRLGEILAPDFSDVTSNSAQHSLLRHRRNEPPNG
jgi:hypothetical protein